ncbi:MAG: SPFH/Band 7/PHB domain protein, partial [Alphaproteobacteria bacterium]|nr:SPFH/Band 7/PHB domain protein [Alphaproteobacteria bacterium]
NALEGIASAPNQKIVLMPLEASGVIGAVAGLTEIAREAFGSDGEAALPAARRRGGSVPPSGSGA